MATTDVRPRRGKDPDKTAAMRIIPPRWRERLVPKTVMGITMLVLALAVGAACSSVVLYSYYEYRLAKTEDRVTKFINGFGDTVTKANDSINAQRDQAKAEVEKELEPIKQIQAEGQTLGDLSKKAAPSLFFVRTLDEAGQPSVGSAFAVASDANQTFLITSFTTVRAATKRPGPDVFVRQGKDEVKVQVWTWQEERDLALIILPKGNIPKLEFAPATPPMKIGERIFAMSGLGGSGASASQGFVGDVSQAGIQHNAAIGPSFQGGPLLNSDGKVVAIASRAYAPLGFANDGVWFGVPAQATCEKVLKCPGGTPSAAGDQR
jgi:S1-C subfamily serine protease